MILPGRLLQSQSVLYAMDTTVVKSYLVEAYPPSRQPMSHMLSIVSSRTFLHFRIDHTYCHLARRSQGTSSLSSFWVLCIWLAMQCLQAKRASHVHPFVLEKDLPIIAKSLSHAHCRWDCVRERQESTETISIKRSCILRGEQVLIVWRATI